MATTSETVETAARLRLAIARTARRLRQQAGSDLTPSLAAGLATIDCHGPLTPSEFADREGVRRPTATRVIARLVGDGLVQRAGDPHDGRSTLLTVTPKGTQLIKQSRSRKNAYLARRMRDLPPEDIATLDRAADVLERLLEGGDGRK